MEEFSLLKNNLFIILHHLIKKSIIKILMSKSRLELATPTYKVGVLPTKLF